MSIRKGYSDTPEGQIHWRIAGEMGEAPDLLCLHPAPFSGLAFTAIMPFLARNRRVIAPDFPGHGGSDPSRADAKISDYARAMVSATADLAGEGPVDLLGFHTGCLVACEMSLQDPRSARRLVLVDVPAFDAQARANRLVESAMPPRLIPDLDCLGPAWERGITRRIESQGMDRSFAMFVEQLRHGEAMNAGFRAGLSYEVEDRLARITHPVTVIATQSGLLEATLRAAQLIPGARLVRRLDITRAVLDEAAAETAGEVMRALGV